MFLRSNVTHSGRLKHSLVYEVRIVGSILEKERKQLTDVISINICSIKNESKHDFALTLLLAVVFFSSRVVSLGDVHKNS